MVCVQTVLMDVLIFISSIPLVISFGLESCHQWQFRDSETGRCKSCSVCPDGQIIRKPCGEDFDNVCGPFFEFKSFNQADPNSRPSNVTASNQDKIKVLEDNTWYVVTMAMIGILVITSVSMVILGAVTCWMYRRRRSKEDAYAEPPETPHDVIVIEDPTLSEENSQQMQKLQLISET